MTYTFNFGDLEKPQPIEYNVSDRKYRNYDPNDPRSSHFKFTEKCYEKRLIYIEDRYYEVPLYLFETIKTLIDNYKRSEI